MEDDKATKCHTSVSKIGHKALTTVNSTVRKLIQRLTSLKTKAWTGSCAHISVVYLINSQRIPGVPAIAVLVDSGAEVNIENDVRMYIERLTAPKVRIALADSESQMQCKGYGKCRRWYYDTKGQLYIDEYWAYYCPDAPYAIRSTRDIARTGGTVVENPGGKQSNDYTTVVRSGQSIRLSGTNTNLVMGNGRVLEASPLGGTQTKDKNVLAWLQPIQPTRVQTSDRANERKLYADTTRNDTDVSNVKASLHAINHVEQEQPDTWTDLHQYDNDRVLRVDFPPRTDRDYRESYSRMVAA